MEERVNSVQFSAKGKIYILDDNGIVWVWPFYTNDIPIQLLNSDTTECDNVEEFPIIKAIKTSPTGAYFIGEDGSLWFDDNYSKKIRIIPNITGVLNVFTDVDNNVFLLCDRGKIYYNLKNRQFLFQQVDASTPSGTYTEILPFSNVISIASCNYGVFFLLDDGKVLLKQPKIHNLTHVANDIKFIVTLPRGVWFINFDGQLSQKKLSTYQQFIAQSDIITFEQNVPNGIEMNGIDLQYTNWYQCAPLTLIHFVVLTTNNDLGIIEEKETGKFVFIDFSELVENLPLHSRRIKSARKQ